MNRPSGVLVILIVVMLVLSTAGCISPPKDTSPGSGGSGSTIGGYQPGTGGTPRPGQTTAGATPAPGGSGGNVTVPATLQQVTPYSLEPIRTNPPGNWVPVTTQTPIVYQYHDVFNQSIRFNYTSLAYAYNLSMPPLTIDLTMKPDYITRKIWYENRTGTRQGVNETVTEISPDAWFELTVRDRDTGEIVLSDGFGKQYDVRTQKRDVIRESGSYQFDLRGNGIDVTVRMYIVIQ